MAVRSHRAIATRDGVAEALSGTPGPVLDILEFDLDDVARFDDSTGDRLLSVEVPVAAGVADVTELDLLEPGVHPVSVQVRRNGALVASSTTLVDVIRTDGPGRGPFTFFVLAALDDHGPFPDDGQYAAAESGLARMTDVAAALDEPVTVAIPPVYFDENAPDALTRVAGDLSDALDGDDRVLVVPDQPLDPSSAVESELDAELARGVAGGEAALAGAFDRAPAVRSGWIVEENVTTDGATAIRNLGIPLLVVPEDRYRGFPNSLGDFTDPTLMLSTRLTDDSSMRVMIVDDITEQLESDAPGSPIERAVRLMGDASAIRYQLDPDRRSMILTTPDIGVPDAAVLAELATFAAQHPDFDFGTLGQVTDLTNSLFLDGDVHSLELDAEPSFDLDPRARLAQSTRLRAADVGSMLPDDDRRPPAWGETLRTALSTGLTDPQSAALVDEVDTHVAEVRIHVVQPEPFSFTIAGTTAPIPRRVENSGPTPLTVLVHAESDNLTFPEGDLAVVLAANQITNVDIPVEARSNGVFPVEVEIRTPAGNPVTQPIELTARVTTLTGLGRVFTVGAVLVLATWWFTYFRRRRAQRRGERLLLATARHPAVGGSGRLDDDPFGTGDPQPDQ